MQKYTKLRIEIQQKIKDAQPADGINISLRLPDSTKVDAVIDPACTTKVCAVMHGCTYKASLTCTGVATGLSDLGKSKSFSRLQH